MAGRHVGDAFKTERRDFGGAGRRQRAQIDGEELAVARQQRLQRAERRGLGELEGLIALFVILRIAARRGARGDNELCRQHVADCGVGNPSRPRQQPRPVWQRGSDRGGNRCRGANFDTEGTRQQRIVGRQQRIGAGGQARYAGIDRHLLADLGHVAVPLGGGTAGGRRDGGARHDRIDLTRGAVAIGGVGVGQRRGQYVDRAAAAGNERRTQQCAAPGKIEARSCFADHLRAVQRDADDRRVIKDLVGLAGDQVGRDGCHAIHRVGCAVDRTAIGHDQPCAAHRGDAAGQQFGHGVQCRRARLPERDRAERRAQHAALAHGRRGERDSAEGRIGKRRERLADPFDRQQFARGYVHHRVAGGIDLCGGQRERGGDRQAGGRQTRIRNIAARQEAQIGGAREPDITERQRHFIAHIEQAGRGGEAAAGHAGEGGRQRRRDRIVDRRDDGGVPVEEHIRRVQADIAAGHRIVDAAPAQRDAASGGERYIPLEGDGVTPPQ